MTTDNTSGAARPEERVRPWGSLAYRDFTLLWISGLFSGMSRYMREMLNYFLIYELSGSAVQLGLTGIFQAIPVLVLGLISGSLADSVDRKKMLVVMHAVGLTTPFILAALVFTDTIAVWHLWLLTSVTSTVGVMSGPAQRAFIPRLVPRSHLMNAVTLLSAPTQGTLMVGPVLAGVLVDLMGVEWAYLTNGLFQVLSLVAIMSIATSGVPEGARRARVSFTAIMDGLRFTWDQRIILAGFLIDFSVMAVGFYRILLPILAKDIYGVGATGLGVLNAAPAIGSIIASVVLLTMGNIRRKGALIVVSYLLFAMSLVLLGAAPWFWLAIVAAAGLGLADMASYTLRQSLIQLVAPDGFRGRTAATSQIFSTFANTTGAVEIGFAAAILGAPGALILGGVLSATFVIAIGFKMKTLWDYRS